MMRRLGFTLSRNFVSSALDMLKKWMQQRFGREGRNVEICDSILAYCRELIRMAREDGVSLDWVVHTRFVFIVTGIVAIFDRQNLYRELWPPNDEVPRRAGIICDWVVAHERPQDYDDVVLKCNELVEEVLNMVRADGESSARPPFSFMLRLADYYFATDNVYEMKNTLEQCKALNIAVAESTTAKFMQLACAANLPDVPQLFLTWRVERDNCTIATTDVFRLLMFYCRSGGGRPCPQCGEKFNHRNVYVHTWASTPKEQRRLPDAAGGADAQRCTRRHP